MTQPHHWGDARPVTPIAPCPPVPATVPLRVVPEGRVAIGDGLLPPEAPIDQEMVCRRVLRNTHDVVTLVLQPTRAGGIAFAPGQYVTLGLEVDGRWRERCYTISSPPTRPHLLTVTAKKTPGGEVSTWLHDRFRVGDRVQVTGPMGSFSVLEHPAERYLLLSAGSGVTPTLSTLRTVLDLGDLVDIAVVHSARSAEDLICRAELEALADAHPGVAVHWICEEDPSTDQCWGGLRGRLTAETLLGAVPDAPDREVLTCGPPGYMAAAREVLARIGADPSRCHEESFVLGTAGAPPVAQLEVAELVGDEPAATVTFARSGVEVACPLGTTVLAAAADAGVALPSSCSEGMCGTCKQTLLSGRVEMSHQGGIRPREIAQDKFLPCCSTPDGSIVVDA